MTKKTRMSSLFITIYYEDTDCGGVVYYGNYLKYFERGRTELLRERGVDLKALAGLGIWFVVVRAELDYLKPAAYMDCLEIKTTVTRISKARLTFGHEVRRKDGEQTVRGEVTLACVSNGRARKIPVEILSRLNE